LEAALYAISAEWLTFVEAMKRHEKIQSMVNFNGRCSITLSLIANVK